MSREGLPPVLDPAPMGRVVVVDDEPHVSFLIRVVLEGAGYEVAEAANGGAALQLVAAAPTRLVVTDRMMPGMNGTMLIERLRADPATTDIPIVMVSSNPDMSVDADAILTKPFDPHELVQVVHRLIRDITTNEGDRHGSA